MRAREQEDLLRAVYKDQSARLIYVAAKLRVADALASGAQDVAELADRAQIGNPR